MLRATVGLADPREALAKARAAAHRALELDPHQPEAHGVLALVSGLLDYDWPA